MGKLKLWASEVVALISIIPWFLTQRFQAYIHIVHNYGWRHVVATISVRFTSDFLLFFTIISLIITIIGNLRYGYDGIILKRILYAITCGLGVQVAAYDLSDFFSAIYGKMVAPDMIIELSFGLGYFTLLTQLILLVFSCLIVWFTKE